MEFDTSKTLFLRLCFFYAFAVSDNLEGRRNAQFFRQMDERDISVKLTTDIGVQQNMPVDGKFHLNQVSGAGKNFWTLRYSGETGRNDLGFAVSGTVRVVRADNIGDAWKVHLAHEAAEVGPSSPSSPPDA